MMILKNHFNPCPALLISTLCQTLAFLLKHVPITRMPSQTVSFLLPTLDLCPRCFTLASPRCVELAVSQTMNKHKSFSSAADWSRDVSSLWRPHDTLPPSPRAGLTPGQSRLLPFQTSVGQHCQSTPPPPGKTPHPHTTTLIVSNSQ